LGDKISKENTVADIEDIIKLLQKFNKLMNQRKVEIKEKLNTKLEGTYADFGYEPHIFIFDEFASFQSVIQTMEKKKRDEVTKLLSQVILQGRQLGFFLRSEEHTSELQSRFDLVCRLLLEKKKK